MTNVKEEENTPKLHNIFICVPWLDFKTVDMQYNADQIKKVMTNSLVLFLF